VEVFPEITSGPIFYDVREVGSVEANALTPQLVNLMVEKRCRMACSLPQISAPRG
jgi:hypothetical protein